MEATGDVIADFVHALDLHKARIRKLQDALCECPHREFFQASLHDETCPVYIIGSSPPASVPSPPEPARPLVECDGGPYCEAVRHIHGCFADKGNCDHPNEHNNPTGPPEQSSPGQETRL